MSDGGHYLRTSQIDPPATLPHVPPKVREMGVGRPWGTMTQTSKTKSLPTSLLKYLNGDPLSTAMTCLGPMVSHKALLAAMSRPPSHSHVTYAFMAILMLVLLVVGGTHPNSLK